MKKIILGLLFAVPLFSDSIKIYYSHSISGNLLACTCTAIPIAGLSRRVSFLEAQKWNRERDILIEVGDFFSLNDSPVKKKAILEAYQFMGYAGLFPGKNEITYQSAKSWNQWKKFPFVSTNIYTKNIFVNEPAMSPFKVISKKNFKIGLASFTGESIFQSVSKSIADSYSIEKDFPMIGKMVENTNTDFWVVGLYGKEKELLDYKKQFPKNTIFLGAGEICSTQKNGFAQFSTGEKIYCTGGKNGDEIGEIELNSKNGNILQFKLHNLDVDKLKDSPEIQKIADKYQIKS